MNWSLVRSPWAAAGAAISAVFVAWLYVADKSAGSREGSDVTILLWSGWVAFALMAGVCLYSLRKFIHKLGWSPEFRMKVPVARLEEAERRLNELRRRILMDQFRSAAEVEAEAAAALRECRVDGVCRPVVRRHEGGGAPWLVSVANKEPLGRMAKWLHFHVYLGLASGVVLWVHGAGSLASPLGAAMNVLTAIVLVTGVLGTVLFALGPGWITRAEKDMNYEDSFVLEQSLRKKIAEAYAALKPEQVKVFRKASRTGGTMAVQRTALQEVVSLEPAARKEMEDVMVLVAQRRRILEDLRGAARVKFLINIWRAVHVPASILLLGIAVVHIVSVIWY